MVDMDRLALLARIKLTDEEKKRLEQEFEGILGYISKLEEVEVGDIDEKTGSKTVELENVVREDKDPHEANKFSKDLLAEAPMKKGDHVRVRKILK